MTSAPWVPVSVGVRVAAVQHVVCVQVERARPTRHLEQHLDHELEVHVADRTITVQVGDAARREPEAGGVVGPGIRAQRRVEEHHHRLVEAGGQGLLLQQRLVHDNQALQIVDRHRAILVEIAGGDVDGLHRPGAGRHENRHCQEEAQRPHEGTAGSLPPTAGFARRRRRYGAGGSWPPISQAAMRSCSACVRQAVLSTSCAGSPVQPAPWGIWPLLIRTAVATPTDWPGTV